MAACPKCGAELPAGTKFCTECGTNLESEQKEQKKTAVPGQEPAAQQHIYMDPPAPHMVPAGSETVSVGAFFWLTVLFHVPVIGLLACLILAFAPGKKSLQNFARANLIRALIGLLLFALTCLMFRLLLPKMKTAAEDFLGEAAEELYDIGESLDENGVSEKDLDDVLDALKKYGIG